MVKQLNPASAAAEVNKAGQPVAKFKVKSGEASDARQAPPTKKPLPTPLARACGIEQDWKRS